MAGHRLFAIDVLADRNRLGKQGRPHLRGCRVEKDGVVAVGEAGLEIAAHAGKPVRLGELRQLVLVAPNQDRIGHHAVAVRQQHAALGANGSDGARQVLICTHAPGHAVHHYAEPSHCHRLPPRDVRLAS
jgi:hypothetical protein